MDTNYKMKRIYIAGRLNDMAVDYIKNVHEMVKDAEEVRKAGFAIFVPGIDLLCGLVHGDWNYKDYFDNSQPWLDASHAVYVRSKDWEKSSGTSKEVLRAKNQNIPVFFKHKNGLERMIRYLKPEDNKLDITEIAY